MKCLDNMIFEKHTKATDKGQVDNFTLKISLSALPEVAREEIVKNYILSADTEIDIENEIITISATAVHGKKIEDI